MNLGDLIYMCLLYRRMIVFKMEVDKKFCHAMCLPYETLYMFFFFFFIYYYLPVYSNNIWILPILRFIVLFRE